MLVSRRDASGRAIEIIEELCAAGADVRIISADVGDPEAVRRVLAAASDGLPPLRGVFHAAADVEDRAFDVIDYEAMRRALHAKVSGALNLHHQTAGLDFFVLFSSIAATLPQPGQGIYAAANSRSTPGCRAASAGPAGGEYPVGRVVGDWALERGRGSAESGGLAPAWYSAAHSPLAVEAGLAACSDTSCVLAAPVAWDRFRSWEPCHVPAPCPPSEIRSLEKQHEQDSFCGILEAARPGENVDLLALASARGARPGLEDPAWAVPSAQTLRGLRPGLAGFPSRSHADWRNTRTPGAG